MSRIEEVYHLIHSLAGRERVYFEKGFKNMTREPQYFELYRILKGMKKGYDYDRIKERFKNTNIPSRANGLYEAILKSMRSFRRSSNQSDQIKEMLIDNQFLHGKKFFDQCKGKLREARKKAVELGDLLLQLEINDEALKLAWIAPDKDSKEKVEKILKNNEELLEQLRSEIRYKEIYYDLYGLQVQNTKFTPEEKARIEDQYPPALFEPEHLPDSKRAFRRFMLAKAMYYKVLAQPTEVYQCFRELKEWWELEENRTFKAEYTFSHASDVINLIRTALLFEKTDEIESLLLTLDKIGKSNPNNPTLYQFVNENSVLLRVYYFSNTDQYKRATRFILNKVDSGKKEFTVSDPRNHILLAYNIAVAYFMTGLYERCLKWCRIVMKSRAQFHKNLKRGIRLIHLVTVYELDLHGPENAPDFTKAFEATTDYLAKLPVNDQVSFELGFINKLKAYFEALPHKKNEAFSKLKSHIESMAGDYPVPPAGYSEIQAWVSNRPTGGN